MMENYNTEFKDEVKAMINIGFTRTEVAETLRQPIPIINDIVGEVHNETGI